MAGLKLTGLHFYRPAFYDQSFAVDQSFSNFFAAGLQDAGEGRTGYAHFFSRLLLIKAIQVGQSNSFEFIEV